MPQSPDEPLTDAQILRELVARTDAACPACRGRLAPLESDRCPSCSEPLTVGLGLVDPASRHLIAGALPLALGFGFNASLGAIILAQARGVEWRRVVPVYIGAGVTLIALILWYRKRARIRVYAPFERRCAVAFCWLLALAFPVWLGFNVVRRF